MTGSTLGDVFNVKKIRQLVQLMREHELTEIDLEQGEQRIRLRRGGEGPVQVTTEPATVISPAAPAPAAAPAPSAAETATAEPDHISFVKSPMVGTFYSAPSPDAAAYVKVGDHVGPDTTVCIIEAMKVFNEIPAETSGKVVAVLVENGDPVEYGQPLYKIDALA